MTSDHSLDALGDDTAQGGRSNAGRSPWALSVLRAARMVRIHLRENPPRGELRRLSGTASRLNIPRRHGAAAATLSTTGKGDHLLNTMNTPGLANIRLWLLIAAMTLLTTAVLSASFMTTT